MGHSPALICTFKSAAPNLNARRRVMSLAALLEKYILGPNVKWTKRLFYTTIALIVLYLFIEYSGYGFNYTEQKLVVIEKAQKLIDDPRIDPIVKAGLRKEMLELSQRRDLRSIIGSAFSAVPKGHFFNTPSNSVFSTFWGWVIHVFCSCCLAFMLFVLALRNSIRKNAPVSVLQRIWFVSSSGIVTIGLVLFLYRIHLNTQNLLWLGLSDFFLQTLILVIYGIVGTAIEATFKDKGLGISYTTTRR